MSTPVIEHIALNIAAVVGSVTLANGYNQDLVAMRSRRLDFGDVAPQDGTVLIVQADPEPVEAEAIQTGEWTTPFLLQVCVVDSDRATLPIDTRCNQAASDLHRAMLLDAGRGGWALDTTPLATLKITAEEDIGWTGIICPFAVRWRHAYGDPYTKA